MTDKSAKPTKLLWVDLEMTGLDPSHDVILEIAAIITDFNFNTLETYEARINHPKELVSLLMSKNSWWNDFPELRDNFINNLGKGKDSNQVERELIDLVQKHFNGEPVILAGNSIHNDRRFIQQYWIEFGNMLHYRMLDVTTLKILFRGKFDVEYDKPEIHRALDDIKASINELKYYLDWFMRHDQSQRG